MTQELRDFATSWKKHGQKNRMTKVAARARELLATASPPFKKYTRLLLRPEPKEVVRACAAKNRSCQVGVDAM